MIGTGFYSVVAGNAHNKQLLASMDCCCLFPFKGPNKTTPITYIYTHTYFFLSFFIWGSNLVGFAVLLHTFFPTILSLLCYCFLSHCSATSASIRKDQIFHQNCSKIYFHILFGFFHFFVRMILSFHFCVLCDSW